MATLLAPSTVPSSGLYDFQTGTYTLSGLAKLDITLIGAGGAGGNGNEFNGGAFEFRTGGGGGAGELITVPTIYTTSSTLSTTLGVGGVVGNNNGNNGSDGTNTSIDVSGTTYTAQSGKGGKGGNNAALIVSPGFTVADGGDGGAPNLKGGRGSITFNSGPNDNNGWGSDNGANSTGSTGRGMATGFQTNSDINFWRKGGGGAALPSPYNTGGGNGVGLGGNKNGQTYGGGGGGGIHIISGSGVDLKGGNGFDGRALVNVTYLNDPTITSFTSPSSGQLTLNYTVNDAILNGYSAQLYLGGAVYGSAQTGTITGTSGSVTFTGLPNGAGFSVKIKATPDGGVNYTGETTSSVVGPFGLPALPSPAGTIQNISTTTADFVVNSVTPTLIYKLFVFNPGVAFPSAFSSALIIATSTSLTIPISGLSLNSTYEYSLQVSSSYNNFQDSYANPLPTFTTLNVVPPTINSVTPGNNSLAVNFTPVTQGAGITVTNYTVALSSLTPNAVIPSSQTVTGSIGVSQNTNFTGLTNGALYTATVTANSSSGNSSSTATGTPNGPPVAPAITTITNSVPNQLVVNFTPSTSPTPSYVTGYTAELTAPGQTTITTSSPGVTASPITVTGLISGVTYSVIVKANYGSGLSVNSAAVSKIVTGPAAPVTITSVTSANASLTVVFSPSATPATQLGNYVITLTPASGPSVTQSVSPTIPGSGVFSVPISGLNNYVTYTASISTVGTGTNVTNTPVASTNTLSGTPQGPPAAATITSIGTSTSNQLVVNFTQSPTPSPLTNLAPYIVSLTAPAGFPSVSPINVNPTAPSAPLSATFTGLVNGVTYSVIVTTDPSAVGIASTPSTAVLGTPVGPLAHPTNVTTTASNEQLSVAFTAVNPVATIYTATATAAGYPTVSNTSSSSPIVLTGLVNFVDYTVTVVASHSNPLLGGSTPPVGFPSTLGTPSGPPDPATNVTIAAGGDGELVVTWDPSATPPSAITYSVNLTSTVPGTSPQTLNVTPPNPSTGPLSVTFQGLLNGASYSAVVSTIAGSNPPANAPTVSGIPLGIPTQPFVVGQAGNEAIFATVTPSINPLSYIDFYTINLTSSGTLVDSYIINVTSPTTPPNYTYLFTGLNNTLTYSLEVVATAVNPLFINTSPTNNLQPTLAPPQNVVVTPGVGQVVVSLSDNFNSSSQTLYGVYVYENSPISPPPSPVPMLTGLTFNDLPIVISGLPNDVEYVFSVFAYDVSNAAAVESTPFFDPAFNSLVEEAQNEFGTPFALKSAVCYARGTLIGTDRGFVPIENLLMSDKLRTYGCIKENMFTPVHGVPVKTLTKIDDLRIKNRFANIKFIGKFTVNVMHEITAPIRITAGALGKNQPERDLLVSPNHSMLVGDRLIFAKFLVNDSTIYQDMSFEKIEYFHVLSDNHYVINANGAMSETLGSEEIAIFESLYSFPEYIETPTNSTLKHKTTRHDVDLINFNSYTFTEMAF